MLAADKVSPQAGEFAFVQLGEAGVEGGGYEEAEDSIAEELKLLIISNFQECLGGLFRFGGFDGGMSTWLS